MISLSPVGFGSEAGGSILPQLALAAAAFEFMSMMEQMG